MSAIAPPRPLASPSKPRPTVAGAPALPDHEFSELVDGVLREKPMGVKEQWIGSELQHWLSAYVRERQSAGS
jgi:hypothetical protein